MSTRDETEEERVANCDLSEVINTMDERVDLTNTEDVWWDGWEHGLLMLRTVVVEHWHIVPGGIEFERADGSFVWIMLSHDQFNSLTAHLKQTGYRHHAVADYPSSRDDAVRESLARTDAHYRTHDRDEGKEGGWRS